MLLEKERMEFLFVRLLLGFLLRFIYETFRINSRFFSFSLLLLLIFWQGLVEYRKIRECERREEWEGIEFIIRAECLTRVGLDNDRGSNWV